MRPLFCLVLLLAMAEDSSGQWNRWADPAGAGEPEFAAVATAERLAELCVTTNTTLFRSGQAGCRTSPPVTGDLPHQAQGLFVWTSADRRHVRIGRGGEASAFDVVLRVRSESSSWPVDVTFTVATSAPETRWEWTVPAESIDALETVSLPRGTYVLTVSAADHEPYEAKLAPKRGTSRMVLGKVIVRPTPAIRGQIVDRGTGQPLPGVHVQLPSGKTLGVSDGSGTFSAKLPAGESAEAITLFLGGYGARTIPIAKTSGDRDLGRIELSPGGTLRVAVDRDVEKHPDVTTRVSRKEGRNHTEVATGELTASANVWTAENLVPGEYLITAAGASPLQQVATSAEIAAAEVTDVQIEVRPIALTGIVSRGERLLAGATLAIRASPHRWTATVTTDERGEFTGELWQPGRFVVTVTSPDLQAPYSFMDEIEDAGGVAHWRIRIPSGAITGRVVDARKRVPIPGAAVTLDSELSEKDTTQSLGRQADDHGRFVFEGVDAGQHVLTAEADGYAPKRSQTLVFATPDERRQVELALATASKRDVVVTSVDGRPLAGAVVLHEMLPPDVVPLTDGEGRVAISFSGELQPLLLAIPPGGSFAVVPSVPASADALHVVVPPPTAAIGLSVHDETTGAPVANVSLLIRYNGVFLPPPLMALAAQHLGVRLQTDANGSLIMSPLPSGRYDLWVYGTRREAASLMRGETPPAAVVLATTGLQTVGITLRAK